jgi:hypothetical protein
MEPALTLKEALLARWAGKRNSTEYTVTSEFRDGTQIVQFEVEVHVLVRRVTTYP